MRKKFVINGRNFSTMKGFYDEVEKVFTFNLNWKIGRSLDAFNDILRWHEIPMRGNEMKKQKIKKQYSDGLFHC